MRSWIVLLVISVGVLALAAPARSTVLSTFSCVEVGSGYEPPNATRLVTLVVDLNGLTLFQVGGLTSDSVGEVFRLGPENAPLFGQAVNQLSDSSPDIVECTAQFDNTTTGSGQNWYHTLQGAQIGALDLTVEQIWFGPRSGNGDREFDIRWRIDAHDVYPPVTVSPSSWAAVKGKF